MLAEIVARIRSCDSNRESTALPKRWRCHAHSKASRNRPRVAQPFTVIRDVRFSVPATRTRSAEGFVRRGRRVCYFLRKLTLKPAEKQLRNCAWKRCAKRVENPLIFCGLPLERVCKNLWITCGDRVESQRRTRLRPLD